MEISLSHTGVRARLIHFYSASRKYRLHPTYTGSYNTDNHLGRPYVVGPFEYPSFIKEEIDCYIGEILMKNPKFKIENLRFWRTITTPLRVGNSTTDFI